MIHALVSILRDCHAHLLTAGITTTTAGASSETVGIDSPQPATDGNGIGFGGADHDSSAAAPSSGTTPPADAGATAAIISPAANCRYLAR
jgi:hypothetical protein